MYYLYLKTHNNTGLKYLGKTTQDPFSYAGSGKYWIRHLKKHGDYVTTEILAECKTIEEFKIIATHYSTLLDIVKSKEFANLVPETGDGGNTSDSENYKKYFAEHKHSEVFSERGKRSRVTAKENGTDIVRTEKYKKTVNSSQWKETIGNEKIKKCNENRDHKKAGANISMAKQSAEWKKTIGKQATEKRLQSTDWKKLAQSVSATRNSQEWKDTIGKKAIQKTSITKSNPEWKNTIGKDSSKKRTDTISSSAWKEQNYICCIHCNKLLDPCNYKRWHGDKCKQNTVGH